MPDHTEERKYREQNLEDLVQGEKKKKKHTKKRTWDESFEALKVYKSKHGDCNVPLRYKQDQRLGQWVQKLRYSSVLTTEQRHRLNEIGFNWETLAEHQARQWNEKFQRLKEFRNRFGNCRVPKTTVDEELAPWSEGIGKWVNQQRTNRNGGRLDPDKIAKLESIGFQWVLRDGTKGIRPKDEERWWRAYRKLVEFRNKNGHCLVPHFYEDRQLGEWVHTQRQNFVQKNNSLTPERKELLEDIGFVWKVDKADPNASMVAKEWDVMLNHLVTFKATNRHCNVPKTFSKWSLGSWVCTQKVEARAGKLEQRRAERLASIGVTWGESNEQRWEENFLKLRQHKKRYGINMVPLTRSKKLYNFVSSQVERWKKGSLLPERKARLDEIGFEWKVGSRKRGLFLLDSENEAADSSEKDSYLDDSQHCSIVLLSRSAKRRKK
jgi:hypothetical protein